MFTTAEQRALDQLSTATGRLAVLAADQRTKLVAARGDAGLSTDLESLRGFKLDLVRALGPRAVAVLLDPEIALPYVVDEGALPPHAGLLVSLERSGSVRTPDGLRSAQLLPDVGALGVRRVGGTAAKLLVRLRADREDADGANGRLLAAAAADCAASHLLLVVEVLIYRLDDEDAAAFAARRGELILESARLAQECGAKFLKLEYPGGPAECAALTDGLRVPWALLSAGVDHDTFVGQLRTALDAGAAGFIAGRSIWKESAVMDGPARRHFLAGEARRRLDELLRMVS
ncbi:MAG: tagatose-bisphosphate aldolase [Gaiellales bacterium]